MGSPKVQGTKIGTLRSDNWIFSFENELHQKLLLQSISTLIRPSLNIILTESLVTSRDSRVQKWESILHTGLNAVAQIEQLTAKERGTVP